MTPTTLSAAHQTTQDIRVLFVEDNPGDALLVQIQLQECTGFVLEHVASLSAALELLGSRRFDVVLLDLSLPDGQGVGTFEAVRVAAPDTPVVVLTGHDDERTALSMVHAGAQDYLVKGSLDGSLLARGIRYAMERHRLLKAVEAARRREAEQKDKFLSHVSHELRSPLAVSYLYTTNLLDGVVGELTPEQREHLSVAVDGLRAQMRLVDELLATVRSDATLIRIEKSAVSLQALIAQTLHGFGPRAGAVALLDETGGELPPVHADARRIQQVLTNLIDNALKFSPAGGAVRVRAYPSPSDPGCVRVDVSDEGPGIPDKARERIFDCLFHDETAAEGQHGLGLGLYLSKLLVARHDGRIWVEKAGDRGSRFSFTLPFLAAAATTERVA